MLGAAGLLQGKQATCHWAYTQLLGKVGAQFQTGRVVRDGNLLTAGGVTAGIDFGLQMAAEIAGEATARAIQLAVEYDPAPPFDSGTPAQANDETVELLKSLVYDNAAAAMGEALDAATR